MTDDGKERISPEGYSVTDDEKRYLRCLCGGSKTAEQVADELAHVAELLSTDQMEIEVTVETSVSTE